MSWDRLTSCPRPRRSGQAADDAAAGSGNLTVRVRVNVTRPCGSWTWKR